jgi:hypothetical protein
VYIFVKEKTPYEKVDRKAIIDNIAPNMDLWEPFPLKFKAYYSP